MSSRLGAAVLASLAMVSSAAAETRPRTLVVDDPNIELGELTDQGLVPYNTVYLNRCASGCTIKVGSSSSITDSWSIPAQATLTKFPFTDDNWTSVVKCVKDVFSPFKINVVETNPGTANHFEIMVGGAGTDLDADWGSYGGVAPGAGTQCTTYLNNGLVFVFGKIYATPRGSTTCDASCEAEICATAAQEIGHVWNKMDHVQLAADPMTYFGYQGRRYYQNTDATCGSDCMMGLSPYNQTCTGTNKQTRPCLCGGTTQNSYQTVKSLFGLGPGTPPVTKITSPKLGESVQAGFNVFVDIQEDSDILTRVEFKIDGQIVNSLTRGPYVFAAPGTIAEGTHRLEVIAYDGHLTPGASMVDVVVGPPCENEDDCNSVGDVCVGGRCVPGPSVTGGLGTTCSEGGMCASTQCASDGTDSYCVEACRTGECPPDFGCLETGEDMGVCWPGYDDGSGSCGCQTSRGGPVGMILALLMMVVTCRRRRR